MMNVYMEKNGKRSTLTKEEAHALIVKSQAGDKEARDTLVERNVRLVWSVVQRFLNRGYDPDDLFQIGSIGLIKSIDKFDLSFGVRFSTYAVPMIIGEIQRFLRDDGTIKVSRTLKELGNKIRIQKEILSKSLNRSPSIKEIANALNVSPEEVAQAEDAIKYPQSIHEVVYDNGGEPITLLDQLADEDKNVVRKLSIDEAVKVLSEREKLIIYLRYYQDKTQSEVAKRLGISQVQVSRLEKQILMDMKDKMH